MRKSKHQVSVITFAYVSKTNGRYQLLRECIESVQSQCGVDFEHIIIDDGSDVDLSHLENEYTNVKYFKKIGTGILSSTFTFNLGHQIAQGSYCIYLPSDDVHQVGALKGMHDALIAAPDAVMAIGNAIYEYDDGRVVKWSPDRNKIENYMSEGNHINGCAVMWRRTDDILSLLPPNYTGFCGDYDFFATLTRLGKIIYPDIDVVRYRQVTDSTRNKTRGKGAFISSPRKEDKNFYQYSKEARVEFVKTRYGLSLDDLSRPSKLAIESDKIFSLTIHDSTLNNTVVKKLKRRDWKALDTIFSSNDKNYENLKNKILNDNVSNYVLIEEINITSLCLIRHLETDHKILIRSFDCLNDWIIDYLPMPKIHGVLSQDNTLDYRSFEYLGG